MEKSVIGVDVGGTQIRAAVITDKGKLKSRTQRATPASSGPDGVIEAVLGQISILVDGDGSGADAIGIGVPGPVDPETGKIYYPPNLPGWETNSILEPVLAKFDVPVFVGNDANVAALGEQRFGAGEGIPDLLYVTVSTGIGGGIVSGGRLLTGWRGFAAEIGHQTLVDDGPKCGCGQRGHLEALGSGPAIARYAIEAIKSGRESKAVALAGSVEAITSAHLAQAAGQGDELALEVFQRAGSYIGIGLANLIHILEPQLILLGGGVTKAGEILLGPVRQTVKERVMSPIFQDIRIDLAVLGQDVGLYGAAALAFVGIGA